MIELNNIYNIDCLLGLKKLEDNSIDCCVTSPPYYNLRDYQVANQIGLEDSPKEYIQKLVDVFSEVKRVLKPQGTLWLNIGDSYHESCRGYNDIHTSNKNNKGSRLSIPSKTKNSSSKLKPKDLIGIPWMLAFALRDAGYYLRSDIVWAKKNCMPESVKDRPTRSHEYIFLFSKNKKYYYDSDAIKEPATWDVTGDGTKARKARQSSSNKSMPDAKRNGIRPASFKDAGKFNGKHKTNKQRGHSRRDAGFNDRWDQMTKQQQCSGMRNKRDVWNIATAQLPDAHFATFPQEIPAICIKAGCPENGIVLDPFMGSGTTAVVARKLNRQFIGFELNSEYVDIANKRLYDELGMFKNQL